MKTRSRTLAWKNSQLAQGYLLMIVYISNTTCQVSSCFSEPTFCQKGLENIHVNATLKMRCFGAFLTDITCVCVGFVVHQIPLSAPRTKKCVLTATLRGDDALIAIFFVQGDIVYCSSFNKVHTAKKCSFCSAPGSVSFAPDHGVFRGFRHCGNTR